MVDLSSEQKEFLIQVLKSIQFYPGQPKALEHLTMSNEILRILSGQSEKAD